MLYRTIAIILIIVTMGMKLAIILIYQTTFHGYHVCQIATQITKYTTALKLVHITVIQSNEFATTTTTNSSPPSVQWAMAIMKSQTVETVEPDVYSQLRPLGELQPRQEDHVEFAHGLPELS